MSPRLQRIVARREALIDACAEQRARLAAQSAEVERALWFVEPAARAVRLVSSRPVLAALAAGALLALGPRRVLARGSRAAVLLVSAWRLGKGLRALVGE
jgi:hypothetical protein